MKLSDLKEDKKLWVEYNLYWIALYESFRKYQILLDKIEEAIEAGKFTEGNYKLLAQEGMGFKETKMPHDHHGANYMHVVKGTKDQKVLEFLISKVFTGDVSRALDKMKRDLDMDLSDLHDDPDSLK